ncbi:type VI secretion system ImpA family N-terminal domain-containing protein [Pseudomonas sp. F1_0610]|uniref:type VI secretion system ImpA family N-terminal domain-containing protein n=1 Tax=Pseudomonas sp. F1_0610 TaxID=3114284 RepID=UPI0039C47A93
MTTHLKIGHDPRKNKTYAQLHTEISKLKHPAQPDLNWPLIKKLCVELEQVNGLDLDSTALLIIATLRTENISAANPALSIMCQLLTEHWSHVWPEQFSNRVKILNFFIEQLRITIRSLSFETEADLIQLMQFQENLQNILHIQHKGLVLKEPDALLAQIAAIVQRLQNKFSSTQPNLALEQPKAFIKNNSNSMLKKIIGLVILAIVFLSLGIVLGIYWGK